MTNYKILLAILVTLIALNGKTQVQCDTEVNEHEIGSNLESSPAAKEAAVGRSSRVGRIMTMLKDPKANFKRLVSRTLPKIRSRSDRFPSGGPPQRMPVVYQRRPQIMRRVQNGVQPTGPQYQGQSQRFSYEPSKNSRYSPVKGNGVQFSSGKGSVYRPQFAAPQQQHPNSLGQGPSQQYIQNFKASPNFSGTAVIRPSVETQAQFEQYAKQQKQQPQYQEVAQYPIPQSQQPQQYTNNQREQQQTQQYLNQREQYSLSGYQSPGQTPYQPQRPHYQQANPKPYQEPLVQPQNNLQFEQKKQNYFVYEEPEESTRAQIPLTPSQSQQQVNYNQNYHSSSTGAPVREAQDYLKFMSTNEYFLPKRDPNYKKQDEQRDQGVQYQQQTQQSQQYQQYQPQQQLPQHPQSINHYGKSLPDTSALSSYSKAVPVSQLFYQQDPAPDSAVVRGSYQAGSNVFVVNSEGIKSIKHIVPTPPSTQTKTTAAPTYTQIRYNSARNRTPEPLRFEFTERDAVPSSYTNSPIAPLRYKAVATPSTPRIPTTTITTSTTTNGFSVIKPLNEVEDDDPEDGEDMQEAGSDIYGRVPVRTPTGTSSEPPAEQKDTEEYCERICANVQDEDEEIVCGSDGFMYTSESQMECYASCLHIDVTIQSKGSCNAS